MSRNEPAGARCRSGVDCYTAGERPGPAMRRIHAASLVAGVAAAVAVLAAGGSTAAQSVERHMIVTVLDDDDVPVGGLGPRDLTIREDGTSREVLRVAPAGGGRQIAVLVDTSEAAARATRDFRAGLGAFFEAMHEGNEISLISFGGPPRILVNSTRKPRPSAGGGRRCLRLRRVGRLSPRCDGAGGRGLHTARRGAAGPRGADHRGPRLQLRSSSRGARSRSRERRRRVHPPGSRAGRNAPPT